MSRNEKRPVGRPPLGAVAMTPAERLAKFRKNQKRIEAALRKAAGKTLPASRKGTSLRTQQRRSEDRKRAIKTLKAWFYLTGQPTTGDNNG